MLELRPDGKLVVTTGAMRMVVPRDGVTLLPKLVSVSDRSSAPLTSAPSTPEAAMEIDLRGLTGDEAEQATLAAVDAAILAEQPFLRIIHGMGTGVVRERVRQVVSRDRRVTRFGFAPRNQGGTGVTVVEFSA